jgi:hypothetical protein
MPKYPNIKVRLTGEDGNAFNIIGKVHEALKKNKVLKEDRNLFLKEAMSGDYNNLLQVCMRWVQVR